MTAALWMVPPHWERLSNSGKAKIPLSPDIMKVISSCLLLLPNGPHVAPQVWLALLCTVLMLVVTGSWFYEPSRQRWQGVRISEKRSVTAVQFTLNIVLGCVCICNLWFIDFVLIYLG